MLEFIGNDIGVPKNQQRCSTSEIYYKFLKTDNFRKIERDFKGNIIYVGKAI